MQKVISLDILEYVNDTPVTLNKHLQLHYPRALFGSLIIRGVDNTTNIASLVETKTAIEFELRNKFANLTRKDLDHLPNIHPYTRYYKMFGKTYHVRLQLESILSGKPIPLVSPLVTSMFLAEIHNHILTAGHDLDVCAIPLEANIGQGNERYTLMSGQTEFVKPKDMYIRDSNGIISSIILGPDQRTKITPKTKNAIYTVYAPEGIEEKMVVRHLQDIADYVLITNSQAQIELLTVLGNKIQEP